MKAYLVTTGAIFGLITVAHLWRIIDEWPHLAREPGYLLLTAAAAALAPGRAPASPPAPHMTSARRYRLRSD